MHGKDSEEVRRFTEAASNEYDTEFAYRFMSRLRNYAQHRRMPVHGGRVSARLNIDSDGAESMTHSVSVVFRRDRLLEERDVWGATVRAEIEAMSPTVQVLPLLDSAMAAVRRVAAVGRSLLFSDIRTQVAQIATLWSQFADKTDGDTYVVAIPEPEPGQEMNLGLTRIDFRLIHRLRTELSEP
jgi:hypothetical protein